MHRKDAFGEKDNGAFIRGFENSQFQGLLDVHDQTAIAREIGYVFAFSGTIVCCGQIDMDLLARRVVGNQKGGLGPVRVLDILP